MSSYLVFRLYKLYNSQRFTHSKSYLEGERYDQNRDIATVVEIVTKAMFEKHYYSFGGKIYHQRGGGPIGLRGTCAVARVTMQMFDLNWKMRLDEADITTWLLVRYMDDARAFLPPFQPGWRYGTHGLEYSLRWAMEDVDISPTERTKRVLSQTMEGVEQFLSFTFETCEDEGFQG